MSGLLSRLPTKARNFIDKHILGHAGPNAGAGGGNPPPQVQPQAPQQTPWTAARPTAPRQPPQQPLPPSQPPNRPPPLTPPEQSKADYEAARNPLATDEAKVQQLPDQPASLKLLRDAYTALAGEIKTLTDASDYTEALKKVPGLKTAVENAVNASDKQAQDKLAYETERGKLTVDEGKVKLIPDLPASLKLLREAYTTLSDAITLLTDAGKYDEALLKLPELKTAVEKAITASEKQAQDKLTYETERGKLTTDEGKVKLIGDTPGYLKTLRETYSSLSDEIKILTDAENYDDAAKKLPALKQAVAAALTGVTRNTDESDTKTKCDNATNLLFTTTGKGIKAWKDVGSVEWKAAVDIIVDLKVDDAFTAQYDKVCDKVADELVADDTVKEAFTKWTEWTSTPEKIVQNKDKLEALMKQVIKIQSKELGIDPPIPVETYQNPSEPGDCGGFSKADGKIKINIRNGSIGDFREMLDTLTHENTHAYQAKLIAGKKDGTLKPGDPEYNAAQIFELNTNTGYITPSESRQYPGKGAYMKQPKEAHAWRAGSKTGGAAFDKLTIG